MCRPATVRRVCAGVLGCRAFVRRAYASPVCRSLWGLLILGAGVLGLVAPLAAQSPADLTATIAGFRNDLAQLDSEVSKLRIFENHVNPKISTYMDTAKFVRNADALAAECREIRKLGDEAAAKWQAGAQFVQTAEQAAGETRQDAAAIRPSLDRVDQLAANLSQREQAAEIVQRYEAAQSTAAHGGERLAEARRLNNEAKTAFSAEKDAVQVYTTAQQQIDFRLKQLDILASDVKASLTNATNYEQDRQAALNAADSLVMRLQQFQTSVRGKDAAAEKAAAALLAEARAVRSTNLTAYAELVRKIEADRAAISKQVKASAGEAAALRNRRDRHTQFADQAVAAADQALAAAEARLAASRGAYDKALEFLRRKTPDPTPVPPGKVRVPVVTDLKVNEATARVRQAGLVPALVLAGESPVSADTTIVNGQDPSAGTEVDVGATVNISFSATTVAPPGPRPPDVVEVPDLVGLPAQQAYAKLAGLALTPSSTFDRGPAPAGKAGTVKSQNPPPGTKLSRTFAVDLTIYGAVVPSVIGRSVSSANAILNDVGLTIDRVAFDRRPPSEQDADKIYLQNPAGGEPLAPDKKLVSVHVYSAWDGGASPSPATVAGGTLPPPTKPGGGFQPGDGALIHPTLTDAKISDGAYVTPPEERTSAIAPLDLPSVGPGAQLTAGFHGYKQGQDPPWDSRNVALRRCTDEEEAKRLFRDGVRIEKEFKAKPLAAGGQATPQPAPGVIDAGFRVNKLVENATYFYVETSNWGPYQSKAKGDWSRNEWRGGHVLEVYRDVFLISTAGHKCRDPEVKENLEEEVRTMVENAKKLIDRRFPPQK